MSELTHPVEGVPAAVPARRRRRGRKRVHFAQMPVPSTAAARALWLSASEEERRVAHRRCASILEYWLGRITKEEAAARLEIPQIRVFQLSQQALAGMGAAMLRQPRSRGRGGVGTPALDPAQDPRALRKRIGALEGEVRSLRAVVRVLGELPANRHSTQRHGIAAKRPKKATKKSPRGHPPAGGALAGRAGATDSPGGAAHGGPHARGERAEPSTLA